MTHSETVDILAVYRKVMIRLGQSIGVPNILEKCKLDELLTGQKMGHRVYTASTGEKKGVDAEDDSGNDYEYKRSQLKSKEEDERFLAAIIDGTKTMALSMTYNNGSKRENVESYRHINHIHTVFSSVGDLLSIVQVDTDHVIDSLMKRIMREENGQKYSSTNGNSVPIHYENGGVRNGEGKVVYINDTRE